MSGDAPIFIVGCPRSGTGLLRDLLRSHPRISIPGESHFLPLLYHAYGDPASEREARKLARVMLRMGWVRRWDIDVTVDDLCGCRSYREMIETLYRAWLRKEGKQRWGDKTPQYVLEIPLLRHLFPEAQLIHIHRDGRDVALSWLKAPFGPSNVLAAARKWRHLVGVGHRACGELSAHRIHEVRYESLIENPRQVLGEVCEFLGEDFHDGMITPSFMERSDRPPIVGVRLPTYVSKTEIVRTNSYKWKQQMSAADRCRFESIAGEMLEELGYERSVDARSVGPVESAVWGVHDGARRLWNRVNIRKPWMRTFWLVNRAKIRSRVRRLASPHSRDVQRAAGG